MLLVIFISTSQLYAQANSAFTKKLIKLIYRDGFLINQGQEDLLNVEIVSPFYMYLGAIRKNKSVNVSHVKTKFVVQYTARQWLGEYEIMKQTFIPLILGVDLDVGLGLKAYLKGSNLKIMVTSRKKITDTFIEILSDIPIKISDDRVRYVLSSVGVSGQNLKRGPIVNFKLHLLADQEFYKVPIQVTYVYGGASYDKVFFFSFKVKDFKDEA